MRAARMRARISLSVWRRYDLREAHVSPLPAAIQNPEKSISLPAKLLLASSHREWTSPALRRAFSTMQLRRQEKLFLDCHT